MSHKQWHSISSTQKQTKFKKTPNKAREKKATLSLSRSLWSIHFSPPLATSYQKVWKCIVLNDSQASRESVLLFIFVCTYLVCFETLLRACVILLCVLVRYLFDHMLPLMLVGWYYLLYPHMIIHFAWWWVHVFNYYHFERSTKMYVTWKSNPWA